MKYRIIQLTVVLTLLLAACQNEGVMEDRGEKIALSFQLYKAGLTKAETGTSGLGEGTLLRAYAYTKGVATTESPVGQGDYAVDNTGKATAIEGKGLFLYRGEYDIYLVSVNSPTSLPEIGLGNLINVSNNEDFMYSSLVGITVQPTYGGQNEMSVDLLTPFTRLCSQVVVTVKAGDKHLVTPSTLVVKSVKISKLSGDLSYRLGESSWSDQTEQDGVGTLSKFTLNVHNSEDLKKPHVSDPPLVVLPLNGNKPLEFELALEIGRVVGDANVKKTYNYYPKVYKSFLPGMTYQFDFTLTFFGDDELADLSLAMLEYTTVTAATDAVGK